METSSSFNVEDQINNCRLCFKPLTDQQKTVQITEMIEEKFLDLTQIQLCTDEDYSKLICIVCDNDLNVFSNFRSNMIEKQQRLYEAKSHRTEKPLVKHELEESPNVIVKSELEEDFEAEEFFIDCSTYITDANPKQDQPETTQPKRIRNYVPKKKPIVFEDKGHQSLFDEMRKLLKKSKDKKLPCPECFKLMDRHSIKEHILVVHMRKNKFSCDYCEFEASRRIRLLQHLQTVHKYDLGATKINTKPKKQCHHCGSEVRDYRRHIMKVHMNIKNVFCDVCPYASFFKYDMEQHMKVHVKKVKEAEKFFCEVCGLEFEKRFHLNAHMKAKHTVKERNHQCIVCDKTFFTAENLKKHAESHEARDKPCEFCGKLFTCMNNLRTHLYYHSDPKFVCDFPNCDKKFYMKKRLRAHLKSHRGQKDFVCEICDKSYFSQNDLNRHTFSIHKKLRFFCQAPGCNGNFSRREYYKKHALAHHQNLGTEGLEFLLQAIREAQPSQRF